MALEAWPALSGLLAQGSSAAAVRLRPAPSAIEPAAPAAVQRVQVSALDCIATVAAHPEGRRALKGFVHPAIEGSCALLGAVQVRLKAKFSCGRMTNRRC